MISTERLAEIKSKMEAALPLATHGDNAFDSVTRILVSDVHGMIEAIEQKVDQAPKEPFRYEITIDQALLELPRMLPEARQEIAGKVLAVLTDDDRQKVFTALMSIEQGDNGKWQAPDPAAGLDHTILLGLGHAADQEFFQVTGEHDALAKIAGAMPPGLNTWLMDMSSVIRAGETLTQTIIVSPAHQDTASQNSGSDPVATTGTGTEATATAGEPTEQSEGAGTDNPPEQNVHGSGSAASGADPAAGLDGSNTLGDASELGKNKPTPSNPTGEPNF